MNFQICAKELFFIDQSKPTSKALFFIDQWKICNRCNGSEVVDQSEDPFRRLRINWTNHHARRPPSWNFLLDPRFPLRATRGLRTRQALISRACLALHALQRPPCAYALVTGNLHPPPPTPGRRGALDSWTKKREKKPHLKGENF